MKLNDPTATVCRATLAVVDALVSGELGEGAAEHVRRHFVRCPECRRAFDDRVRVRAALARAIGRAVAPPSLHRAIGSLVRLEAAVAPLVRSEPK